MNLDTFLFGIITFGSVLLYFPIANAANWQQRNVKDFETTYWNAAQAVIWGLGLSLMRGSPLPNIWAVLPIFPTTIIYGLIAEQPGMNFDLTGNSPLTPLQIGVLTVVGILVLGYIGVIFYTSDKSTLGWKLAPLMIFVIWILTWLGVDKSQKTQQTTAEEIPGGYSPAFKRYGGGGTMTTTTNTTYNLHFHHWMIATIGYLLSISPDIYSQFISGIFWGIFCQETAAYGIMPPSDTRQSSISTFTPTYLGPGGTQQY